MQLTELLAQRVKQMGERAQVPLRPGYTVIVSGTSAPRHALLAALFAGPQDQRNLSEGEGATRIGIGVAGADGSSYRLLRELGAGRHLQRLDLAAGKYQVVTDDDLEIDSFLRVDCGLPSAEAFLGFFVLEQGELPSQRGKPQSQAAVDPAKVKALREELEMTKRFEAVQDRLFKVQQRLLDLSAIQQRLADAEKSVRDLDAELARAPWTPQQMADLAARAKRFREDMKRRDEAMAEIALQRQRLSRSVPATPDPLLRDPLFGGGIAGGVALDAAAFVLRKPPIALLGLLPFLGTVIASLRWIAADEADTHAASEARRLKEREEKLRKAFAEEQAPLKNAMRAANVDTAGDLLDVFRAHEAIVQKRDAARAMLQELKADPELPKVPVELPLLSSEKARLETQVSEQGFARAIAEIEIDLKHALGLEAERKGPLVPDAELPADLVDRAADLMHLGPDELWTQLSPRLAVYLSALTDKRLVAGQRDDSRNLVLQAADGRSGPFQGLPQPLKDLAWTSLRLACLEKMAAYKKVPIVIDDAFASLEAEKRALVAKMLKALGQLTQVVHRCAEAPPPGAADHVVQLP